jgi:hypothetical protein
MPRIASRLAAAVATAGLLVAPSLANATDAGAPTGRDTLARTSSPAPHAVAGVGVGCRRG